MCDGVQVSLLQHYRTAPTGSILSTAKVSYFRSWIFSLQYPAHFEFPVYLLSLYFEIEEISLSTSLNSPMKDLVKFLIRALTDAEFSPYKRNVFMVLQESDLHRA